jgi:error-prone DNA polymerase
MPDDSPPKTKVHPAKQPGEAFRTKRHHWTRAKEVAAAEKKPKWHQGWGGFKDQKGRARQLLEESPPPKIVKAGSEVAFAELCCTSNFTFLTGASHPDEIAKRAAELGYQAFGVCDTNTLAGVVRAHVEAERQGVRQVVGSRVELADGQGIYVWPTDLAAYNRLATLLTIGKLRARKGQCSLGLWDLLEYAGGQMLGVEVPAHINDDFVTMLRTLQDWCGGTDALSLVAARAYGHDDEWRLRDIARLSAEERVPMLATNRPLYHVPGRRLLQDVVACIRQGCTLDEAGLALQPAAERFMKVPEEMARLFSRHPRAIDRTVEVAARCTFGLDELKYQYPGEVVPEGETAMGHLTKLARAGYARRFPEPPPEKVRKQFEHELVLIGELDLPHYFLTVEDLVRWSREQGILCQGRGAAANSIVCYSLGITDADPRRINTLFERFISRVRNEPPDIDVDFEHVRREEAIQYLYRKYGRTRAAMTANVITYRGRSAVREVGKVLGFGTDTIDRLAKGINWWKGGPIEDEELAAQKLDRDDPTMQHFVHLSTAIQGFPRHLSQHPGGFVLTQTPLHQLVPIENCAMAGRTAIEWDKDDIDALGFIKVDVLGLGMLTVLAKAVALGKGLRDKGSEGQRFSKDHHGQDQDVSRSHRLAAGHVAVSADLQRHPGDAPNGAVRADESDATLRRIRAIKYRRRLRATGAGRLHPVPDHFPRLAVRVDDAVRIGHVHETHPEQLSDPRAFSRNGTASARPAQQPEPPPVAPPTPLSLRPSVPSSLSQILQPPDDPAVYDMICAADTMGTFQIESRAQMTMLPRLRPRCFYDLVVEVAIVRPGPIQGGMVHPYLRRRNGEEPVPKMPGKAIEWITKNTFGVPIFQEQAMLMAVHCAGFTPDEADGMRRAVTGFRRFGDIDSFEDKIIRGMIANGYDRSFAEQCFKQIQGFSTYGFPESHAASFALIAYASCYLKHHWPDVFLAAILNSQPMGFYQPAQLVQDAQRHGVTVLPVDVLESGWECSLGEGTKGLRDKGTKGAERACTDSAPESLCPSVPSSLSPRPVRLGMNRVKGLREDDAQKIIAARDGVTSMEQLWKQSRCTARALTCLAKADAFGSMGLDRQSALWHAGKLKDDDAPLFDATFEPQEQVTLPSLPPLRHVLADYSQTGLSLKDHPMRFLQAHLDKFGVTPADQLADAKTFPPGRAVAVAGICLVRQRPGSAKSITFLTLEDATGMSNLVVYPTVFERFKRTARDSKAMLVHGRIDRQGEVVHVIAESFKSLDERLAELRELSRNFH